MSKGTTTPEKPSRLRWRLLWGDAMQPRMRSALAVVIMLVWATCYVVIKAGLRQTTPLFFAALRALPAGVVLLLVARLFRRPAPSASGWGWIALLALFNVALGFGGMFLGVGLLTTGIAAVLNNSQPLVVAVLAALLLRERLGWLKGSGLLLGFAGVTLITAPYLNRTGGDPLGPWFILTSALGLAAGSVIVKAISPSSDILSVTAWQFVGGGLLLLGAAARTEDLSATVWSPGFLASLAYLTLIGTALTFLLWFFLIQKDEVSRLTTYNFLVPVFGLVLGIVFYREVVSWVLGVGVLVTLVGVLLVSLPARPARGRTASAKPGSQ